MTTAIVPAAGLGTRMGTSTPKALLPLAGRPLIARVLDALGPHVERLVLVIRPGQEETFANAVDQQGWPHALQFTFQPDPSGSADAVARALDSIPGQEPCIVVWADQAGASKRTVGAVAAALNGGARGLVLPLVAVERPYVWYEVDDVTPVRVGRQRDGDRPPEVGYSDVGIFGFWADTAREILSVNTSSDTTTGRETDFVYAAPLFARRQALHVIAVQDANERFGVNTPDELTQVQRLVRVGR